ncbi:AAA family ATPase [Brachybacterium epidermidis]|uniref:AAA family ATPase n=1 Tax=Brachybacterium epidermidis TaxID=2781983 RepID=UPI00398E6D86
MILSFAVTNFRSFAGTAELDLTSPALRTVTPRGEQTWAGVTERVAAIYGPNAAGKSALLEAIKALSHSVRTPGSSEIYQPHAASEQPEPCTEYEVEFVAADVRYTYSVSAAPWGGINREELRSAPKGTSRLLFRRTQEGPDADVEFTAGASLTGPTAEVRRITKPSMLFLATAHRFGHEVLAPVARALLAGVGIDFLSFRERLDEQVLERVVMEMVAAPASQVSLVKGLVQAADLGIEGLEVRTEEIPPEVQERIARLLRAMEEGDESSIEVPSLQGVVVFNHRGPNGGAFDLGVHWESSGTVAWLTTAWHALDALRQGSVLLVDELDASLHPDLARYIVELFLNPELNSKGAQLIFSSHDVSLLGNSPTRLLEPRQVWFVEKDDEGVSELFSLDDFDNRSGNNNERRYLAGAFGAVPNIDDRELQRFLNLAVEGAVSADA